MIDIYTDGACIGNPGPGGWAAIVVRDGQTKELFGREDGTTNNRMEILAAINGLEATPDGARVTIHSDSQYVVNTVTKNWKRNANQDLWVRLDKAMTKRIVQWKWVRGHNGHPQNEKADKLANSMARAVESGAPDKPGEGANEASLSHLDASGKARMVDVGWKPDTERVAVAKGSVKMKPETLELVTKGGFEKGDVLGVARVAGVMAAKRTWELIPLCHPIPLNQVTVDLETDEKGSCINITGTAKTNAKTGVEMEALTAVSVAALTIYDMCKSADKAMRIEAVRLVSKSGGKSGDIVLE